MSTVQLLCEPSYPFMLQMPKRAILIQTQALHLRHSSTELALVPVSDAIGATDGGVVHATGNAETTARPQETSTVDLKPSHNSI